MNMPKSRDIQAKMPSPKVILNAFWHVTVKVLNSYDGRWMFRESSAGIYSVHYEADIEKVTPSQCPQYKDKFQKMS